MPTATVTVREVKNKDTGIDLTVPTFKEVKGMLSSTFYYRVVVVSNLQVFKSPKHRESDTVQFMVEKKFSDFEDLYDKLNAKFSGTVLPPLPKKVLMVNEPIARARRSELEHFVKFLASVPKISTSSVVLEFLGVGSMKAGAFRKGEIGEHDETGDEKAKEGVEDEVDTGTQEPEASLFDDEDNEEGDELFAEGDVADDHIEDENIQLFEAPDLGGGISQDDDSSLFLPDAIVEKKIEPTPVTIETDPTVYQIDDDLEEIMKLDLSSKTKRKEEQKSASCSGEVKPTVKLKPTLKPKPGTKPKPEAKPETNLSSDDILSYIQENESGEGADLDLFS